ncbi:sugar-transfer associated ATP-grasp domain-containing protein [Halomonas maura]|uniref:sugar-transfer associated ATP-grasp domain-containing protein n=1 Tax=Halomonas maura TaxID=117606 RepID=UPI0025B2C007|nr:sugar-transfer associated ATP-grasp domain-containing protein [Halomonas maura]MDN3557469.1 sugar-transfer associated ATP-grasp domain-containing protein [Halomonas maura]
MNEFAITACDPGGSAPLPDLPEDHHRHFMANLSGVERLSLLKRFTLDFHADPDLGKISEEQAEFLYERGFLPEKIRLYGLNRDNIDLYLSDVQRWLTRLVNGPYSIVFNNKVLFTQVFGRYCRVPGIIAIFRNGRAIPYCELWDRIISGQDSGRMMVAKPLGGGGGGSVYFIRTDRHHAVIETNDEEGARVVVKVSELAEVLAAQEVPFILNDYIQQGDFTQALFPLTVNTLRVLVIRHPVTRKGQVIRAVQRIGTSESYPIDNFSLGGLSAEINLANGELSHAVAAEGKHAGKRWESHPDTGEKISEKRVPHWEDIKEDICRLFENLPYIKYCGFDLIIDDDGFIVLEGNSYSQVRLFQMSSPLLDNQVLVDFYKSEGLLVT